MIFYSIILLFLFQLNSYPQNCISIDTISKKIYGDFSLDRLKLKGEANFYIKKIKDFWIFNLDAKDITIEDVRFSYLKLKFIKKDDTIFIKKFSLPGILLSGKFNLFTEDTLLNIKITKHESTGTKLNLEAKIWGKLSNPLISGTLVIEDGLFGDVEFRYFFIDFFGNMSTFNITEAKIFLIDGSSYKIEGFVNVKNFDNIFSAINLISEKIAIGDWKLALTNSDVVFKKEVDERFSVSLGIQRVFYKEGNPKAEVRYKIKDDNFLKLGIQDNKDIIGFERRKEF